MTQRRLVYSCWRFGRVCCLHPQDLSVRLELFGSSRWCQQAPQGYLQVDPATCFRRPECSSTPLCQSVTGLDTFRHDLSILIYIFKILLNILTFLFTPLYYYKFIRCYINRRSQWQCGLRPGSAAARLLGLRVRKTSRAWRFVYCQVEVSRPEYPTERVFECDREASTMRRPWPIRGRRATRKNYYNNLHNMRRMIRYFNKSS
jgi:hypothetical protein